MCESPVTRLIPQLSFPYRFKHGAFPKEPFFTLCQFPLAKRVAVCPVS